MGTQVCFTADDKLLKIIDDLAERIERSRSDTVNLLLWLVTQSIKDKKPSGLGELVLSVSGGSAATFGTEPRQPPLTLPPLPKGEVDMEILKRRWQSVLQDLWGKHDPQIRGFFIDDKLRIFYIVKELAAEIAPGLTRQTLTAINEQLEAVKVELEVEITKTDEGIAPSDLKVREQPLEHPGFDPVRIAKRVLWL